MTAEQFEQMAKEWEAMGERWKGVDDARAERCAKIAAEIRRQVAAGRVTIETCRP